MEKQNSRALSEAPSVSVRQASCFQEVVMLMVQTVKSPGAPNRNPVSLGVPGSERQTCATFSLVPGRFSALDGDTLTMHDTILPAHRSTPWPPWLFLAPQKANPFGLLFPKVLGQPVLGFGLGSVRGRRGWGELG